MEKISSGGRQKSHRAESLAPYNHQVPGAGCCQTRRGGWCSLGKGRARPPYPGRKGSAEPCRFIKERHGLRTGKGS